MSKSVVKIIFFLTLLVAWPVSAHQPNYSHDATWVRVSQPEISRAFYGSLPGSPVRYVISSPSSFPLYLGLLVPNLPDINKNLSVSVINQNGQVLTTLNGEKSNWSKWDEEFAGDVYWKGPEFKQTVPAGTYTIVVYSKDNDWDKYVLAIGEKESFPFWEYPRTEKQLYQIKTEFFGKSWYSIFEGKIGRYQLGGLLFLIFLILFIDRLAKIFRRKNLF